MTLIDPKDAENIYTSSPAGPPAARKRASGATEILEAVDELPDDLGEEQPKYPIGVSLIQVFAETHRDVLFGMPPSTDVSPVSILLTSDDDQYKSLCDEYQKVITRVLYQSKAASLFMRAGLMMQVLGGWAFKVTSEPHARHLKYRTRLVGLEPEVIEPTYDLDDVWRLRECLINIEHDPFAVAGRRVAPGKSKLAQQWFTTMALVVRPGPPFACLWVI